MATPRFYAAQMKDSLLDFASDFARFLVNDLPTFTGPGWTIIEAYDNATVSRQVPSSATDMDSFTGTFSWKDNTVGVNDWIVLQSNIGGGVNECQAFFRMASSTTMQVQLVPLGNWTTGGAAVTTPTKPATIQPSAVVTMTGFTIRSIYSIVADEGMFAFLFDQGNTTTNAAWIYVGELEGHRPSDAYPYVIWNLPTSVSYDTTFAATGNWRRLSALDVDAPNDTGTDLVNGQDAHYYSLVFSFGQYVDRTFEGVLTLGETRPHPVGIFFSDTGNRHFAGFLRNVYSAHNKLGSVGTFGGEKYMYRNDRTDDYAGICFLWDQATLYPPDPI